MSYNQQKNRGGQQRLPDKKALAKSEGFPEEKLDEFVVFVGDQPYITGAGLQWRMLEKYGPGKFAVQTLMPTLDEYNLLRRMMGLKEEDPLVVMRGEVWITGFDRPFVDYGTASPHNLKGFVKFSDYPLEMACRRASNRAMRLATATGMCSVDEIKEGGEVTGQTPENGKASGEPEKPTTPQFELLRNLSKSDLLTKEENEEILEEIEGLVDRRGASDLIERLKAILKQRKGKKQPEMKAEPKEEEPPPPSTEPPQDLNEPPLFRGENDQVDFDKELAGTPPNMPPSTPPKKKGARNIPQEVRIAFGRITEGTLTALGTSFEEKALLMQFKNQFLGGIIRSINIDPKTYVKDDGFIHIRNMSAAESTKLLNTLSGPGALHALKDIGAKALAVVKGNEAAAAVYDKGQQGAKTPETAPPAAAPELGLQQAPGATGEETSATPPEEEAVDPMIGLKGSIGALQEALSSDYGPDGIKLAATILQKNHLGTGGTLTIENCTAAVEQLTDAYRRLTMGEPIVKVSASLK